MSVSTSAVARSAFASSLVGLSAVAFSGFLAVGCAAQTGEGQGDTDKGDDTVASQEASGEEEVVGTSEQALVSGWTSYVSEETAPIQCDGGSLLTGAQCSGRYCDNTRVYCQPTRGVRGDSYWTPYFSEEGTNYRFCNDGYWATGLACRGSYCDNISLQCSRITNVTARSCYWTGWHSEENGGLLWFGAGYYARGAQCSGSHCDSKRYYVCQI